MMQRGFTGPGIAKRGSNLIFTNSCLDSTWKLRLFPAGGVKTQIECSFMSCKFVLSPNVVNVIKIRFMCSSRAMTKKAHLQGGWNRDLRVNRWVIRLEPEQTRGPRYGFRDFVGIDHPCFELLKLQKNKNVSLPPSLTKWGFFIFNFSRPKFSYGLDHILFMSPHISHIRRLRSAMCVIKIN